MRSLILAALVSFASASAAFAHEYWIDPEDFTVAPGEDIRANFRVGETFAGAAQIFNPNRLRRSEIVAGNRRSGIQSRIGDRPAVSQAAPEGLAVIVVETGNSTLTYSEFEKFESFVTHKDARWTLQDHRARGLPDSGFKEVYSRYAKSLVAVGGGAGSDRVMGLETEIVALKNPYTDDLSGGFPVQVLYRGAPRSGEQLEIFERAPSGAVRVSTVTTDERGRANVSVRRGHVYMLDSVVLRSTGSNNPNAPVWESLWANLTFAVP